MATLRPIKTNDYDQPWVRAQKKAFTGWMNNFLPEHVSKVQEDRLGYDLSNGVVLAELLQALEKRPLFRFHKKPTLKYHRLENHELVLRFMANTGEKLVSIDAHLLEDDTKNVKLLLGLLWRLIQRYSLRMALEEEAEKRRRGDEELTMELLKWVRGAVKKSCNQAGVPFEEIPIDNFTTNFQDGRIFCHLFNSILPDKLNVRTLGGPRENLSKAFDYSEQHLAIPKLLDLDMMVSGNIDKQSVITYVTFFRDRAMKPRGPTKKPPPRPAKQPDLWVHQQAILGNLHPGALAVSESTLDPRVRRELQKQELLRFVNQRIKPFGKKIQNFTEDWKNPLIFCSLVASFDSQAIDLKSVTAQNGVAKVNEGMSYAEKEMEIKQTMDAKKMLTQPSEDENVDYIQKFKDYYERQEALAWANARIGVFGQHADNLTTSWKDPRLLGALVKYYVPDLVDIAQMNGDPIPHFEKVMDAHEDHLKIPKPLAPARMADVSEGEMLNYIKRFREYEENQALLDWVNRKIAPQGLLVKDFTESWRDPRVFCHLMHTLDSNSLDVANLNDDNAIATIDGGFAYANEHFGISPNMDGYKLLVNPDKREVKDYVRQLYEYERKAELLRWANGRMCVYGETAADLAPSWSDPKKLGALVKSFAPPLVDLQQMGKSSTREPDFEVSMSVHHDHLNVPRIVTPSEMLSPSEPVMVDYITLFKELEESEELRAWVNTKINPQGQHVHDFDQSWKNPRALCALVNAFIPDAFNLAKIDASNAHSSVDRAMQVSHHSLQIPLILTAREMLERPNAKQIYNYIKCFREYERKKELLEWANRRMSPYGQQATDFTRSWTDPAKLGALVKSFVPGQVDLSVLVKEEKTVAFEGVMRTHEQELGVLRPLTASAMSNPREPVMIDYIQRFKTYEERQALLAWVNSRLVPQGFSVQDFKESWKDARIICALLNSFQSDAFKLHLVAPTSSESANAAVLLARDTMNIPPTLRVHEMLTVPDADNIAEYIAKFREYERRQELLEWANKRLVNFGLHAENLDDDWRDPKLLGGIVKSFVPANVNLATLSVERSRESFEQVMQTHEQLLHIARVVPAVAMQKPSETAVMEYLTKFKRHDDKQRLLAWVNSRLASQGLKIENFTDSWKDARIICGLINSFDPNTFNLANVTARNGAECADKALDHAARNYNVEKTMSGTTMTTKPEEDPIIEYVKALQEYHIRKELLDWANSRMAPFGERAENLTTSWSNPRALGALVKSFVPEVPLSQLENRYSAEQMQSVMLIHEDKLGIPAVLSPQAMAAPPEKGMVEYIARFKEYEEREEVKRWVNGKLKQQKLNLVISDFSNSWRDARVLCGVVRSMDPSQDFSTIKGSQAQVARAMQVTDGFGVPSNMDAQELVNGASEEVVFDYAKRLRDHERRERLLAWVNSRVGQFNMKAEDFAASWQQPLLLGALVKSFLPKLVDLKPVDEKGREAYLAGVMELHFKHLGIPRMVNPNDVGYVAEERMMDYIAEFYYYAERQALLDWANNRLKKFNHSVSNFDTNWQNPLSLAALVNSFKPNAVDLNKLKSQPSEVSVADAMGKAANLLQVYPTLSAERMVKHPDSRLIQDYIAEFRALDDGTPPILSSGYHVERSHAGSLLQLGGGRDHQNSAGLMGKKQSPNMLLDELSVLFSQTKSQLFDPNNHPAALKPVRQLEAEEAQLNIVPSHVTPIQQIPLKGSLRTVLEGTELINYSDYDSPSKERIFMWYQPDLKDDFRKGKVCWCAPGKREIIAGQTIEIHHISKLYAGKLTPILKHPIANDAPNNCCFSILGYENVRDIEAPSPPVAQAWLNALAYFMSDSYTAEVIRAEVASLYEVDEQSILDPNDPHVKRLFRGRNFAAYFWDGNEEHEPYKKDIFVFLSKKGGKLGTLHFCEAGKRVEDATTCIVMERITDVMGGKQSPVFKHNFARGAHGNSCLTIVSKDTTVNLECQSKDQAQDWVLAFNHILPKAGLKVERRDKVQATEEADLSNSVVYQTTANGTDQELRNVLRNGSHTQAELDLSLFRAAADSNVRKLVALIQAGASIQATDAGQTLLHRALMWAALCDPAQVEPCIRVLIAAGVGVNTLDSEGVMARDYVQEKTLKELRSAFEENRTLDQLLRLYQ